MALSGDDITQITAVVNESNRQLFDRVSEKLELTVEPVKETLVSHMTHDEATDKSMYESLENLKIGQAALKSQMKTASFIGGGAFMGSIGLFFGVVKDLI